MSARRLFPSLRSRGIALITALLAIVLLMTLLTVLVSVGTTRLRKVNEDIRSQQALAAADAGAGWVRALLAQESGDLTKVMTDLSKSHSLVSVSIDSDTSAQVLVSLQLPAPTTHADHVDINLQENPAILETPLQVVATATVHSSGQVVATRTVTTLLRTFLHPAPYSEIVGIIDNAGPSSVFSPGDPAGQIGSAATTDLRIQATTETTKGPVSANRFRTDSWYDGNNGSTGLLP
jgi:Tfp pilus assembly protein PilV